LATTGEDERQDIAVGTYTIDPARSVIRFATKAMFGLIPVRGTFAVGGGTVSVASPAGDSTAEAVVLAASFDSGVVKRDDHVRSADFLDASTHPQLAFRGEGFEPAGTGGTLHGNLTVRDVTRPVTLAVETVSGEDTVLTARATTTIDRYAFGLTAGKGMTGRRLQLTIEIVATR
jgi:polyisoprenoid-binding protein YceI